MMPMPLRLRRGAAGGGCSILDGVSFQQEADHVAIGGRQEADHIAVVVDPGGDHIAPARRDDFREFAGFLVELVAVVDAIAIGVEAHRDAVIVEAEQLIDRVGARVGVPIGGEDAMPVDETEVGAVAIHPEARRVALVIDGRDLGLHRSREVLIGVVVLMIRLGERVALVGMKGAIDYCAAAEVARDLSIVVDAQQLVEGRVRLVIQCLEAVRLCRLVIVLLRCVGQRITER